MSFFLGCFETVIGIMQLKFDLFGFSMSFWSLMIYTLVAGVILSFVGGLFGD